MDVASTVELRARILDAFAAVEYPGDANLGADAPQDPGYEGTIVARFFKGRDWRDITFETILAEYDAPLQGMIAFMKPDGIKYYLPAFLVLSLDVAHDADTEEYAQLYTFVDSLCFYLARPSETMLRDQYNAVKDRPEVPEFIKEHLRNPTPQARQAVRSIVENHRRLVASLSTAQRAAVAETLAFLADCFRIQGVDETFNNAARALAATWEAFRA
ncbi:MAG TPA: hypothetical protein VJ924_07015 [Alphaproteobacteria bacterium]|nr:hypothetical protein [Alphaproteobacteria bacterium]